MGGDAPTESQDVMEFGVPGFGRAPLTLLRIFVSSLFKEIVRKAKTSRARRTITL
jgi:hypothetical protein